MKHHSQIYRIGFAALFILTACTHAPPTQDSPRKPANESPVQVIDPALDINTMFEGADGDHFDVVVVGAGLSGLSSSVYLTDAGKKVLMLEKENHIGGLAAWSEGGNHIRYDRGAAYWTSAYQEEQAILKHIGLGNFTKKFEIPAPIDSYYANGQFYSDIWLPSTVAKLPASFALFKFELERADDDQKIPNQPMEDFAKYGGNTELDGMSARQWVEKMPEALEVRLPAMEAALTDRKLTGKKRIAVVKKLEEGRKILARFKTQLPTLKGPTGMEAVLELLDLYCRSALGNVADTVSAMAFANFYISEIVPRFTTPRGTGAATDHMVQMLKKRKALFQASINSPVSGIRSGTEGVLVNFELNGKARWVTADYAVFAAQLGQAPQLIEGFKQKAPEQAELMSTLGYAHYSVHTLKVKGHPYRAAYDTWVHASDYSLADFTDVILGLWVDPRIRGYNGYRNFKKDPPIADSIMTIYHPLDQSWLTKEYNEAQAQQLARDAAARLEQLFSKLPAELWRGPMVIKQLETSRWPYSVHIAAPGHYNKKARILRQPFGRVHFANNNLGAPAFEEALFRGHCAADNILKDYDSSFKREDWSRCPMDGE